MGKKCECRWLGNLSEQVKFMFFIFPDNCPDAIVRNPDTVEKTRPKIAYFWRFLDHLTHFPIQYQFKILNEGR